MKKICTSSFIFSLLMLKGLSAFSQENTLYIFGNDSKDTKAKVIQQKGNYYLVGTYGSSTQDILLSKLNNYSVEWTKTFDNSSIEVGYNLVEDENGNLFLSASGNNLSSSIFLKLSNEGTPLLSKKLGSFHDRIKFLLPLKDGSLLFYGELEGAITGHNQLALLKTDKNLNPIWENIVTHHGSSDYKSDVELYARELIELEDRSLVFLTSYTAINNPQNDRSTRLVKLGSDGTVNWVKGFPSIQADNPQSISSDFGNGFIFCGLTNGYSSDDSSDMQIVKVDSEGNVVWAKIIGGAKDEEAYKITKTPDKGYLVVGVTNSFGKGKKDLLLVKLDQQGTLQWAKTFGGIEEEVITNLFTLDNTVVLSGHSNSFNGRTHQTFMYEIHDFDQLNGFCFEDVTNRIQIKNIQLNTFNTMYSISSFNAPSQVNLATSEPTLSKEEKCLSCFEDEVYNLEICSGTGEKLTLDASEPEATAYLWENGSTSFSRTIESAGVYHVTVSYAFCTITKTFNVNIRGSEEVNLGEDVSSCEDGSVTLHAPDNLPDGSFFWNNGLRTRTLNVSESGAYWLTYESSCGPITDTVNININSYPTISLGNDLTLCKGERIQLTAQLSGGAISWHDSTDQSFILITSPGKYWASVENECGLASDTIYVRNNIFVETPFIPNVITPNQDSFNDAFVIDEQLTGASLSVYNRWGRLVYFSATYDNSWAGENLSKGTYYVRIHDHCSDQYFTQTVTILD